MNRAISFAAPGLAVAAVGFSLGVGATVGAVHGQDAIETAPALTGDLPAATKLIAMAVDAMGGAKSFAKIKSTMIKATMTLPMGEMSAEMFAAKPDQFLIKQMLPAGMGEILMGSNGETVWMNNPMAGGYQILDEEMAEGMQSQASPFEMLLTIEDELQSIETVGRVTFADADCYKVKMVDKEGAEQFSFFNTENKRIMGVEETQDTPQGPMTSVIKFADWKQFGELNLFTKMVVKRGGAEIDMIFDEIEVNDVDPATFDLPGEVKEMVRYASATPQPTAPEITELESKPSRVSVPTHTEIVTAITKELRENAMDEKIGSQWNILVDIEKVEEYDSRLEYLRVFAYSAMQNNGSRFSFGFVDHFRLRTDGKGAWTAEIVKK